MREGEKEMSIETRMAGYAFVRGAWEIGETLAQKPDGKAAAFRARSLTEPDRGCTLKAFCLLRREGSPEDPEAFGKGVEKARKQVTEALSRRGDLEAFSLETWQEPQAYGVDLLVRQKEMNTLRSQILGGHRFSPAEICRLGMELCGLSEQQRTAAVCPEFIIQAEDGSWALADLGIPGVETWFGEDPSGCFTGKEDPTGVFGVGMVLYLLGNDNRLDACPPDRGPCKLRGKLSQVVMKACAARQEDRYGSLAELSAALGAFVMPAGVSRGPRPNPVPIGREPRPNPVPPCREPVARVEAPRPAAPRQQPAPAIKEKPEKKKQRKTDGLTLGIWILAALAVLVGLGLLAVILKYFGLF